ncbi:glycoside hydrolase family 2 TIM barrel-domain containing protein [Flavicella sediminum]|uniref:glycoside hydrolase family 2 TIM barrel-domain containing protein n=1 Tax=Flavicella sediminum TaxID=2585141 RepID=UPI0011220673|nr:glycoside hydrolase family 2 TIM barrel-domain containing protein [Flavicella sediminum]
MKLYITYLLILNSLLFYGQEKLNFNENWKFALDIKADASKEKFNDTNWRVLDVPHDWTIEGVYDKNNPSGVFCGFLPGGIGWYRKTIEIPENWKNKNVSISFDGVFRNSTVWANGIKLGHRPYGWVSFSYDVSSVVNSAKKVTFVVKVDNSLQSAARWYTGSGIYANTYLEVKNKIHIPKDGVFVRTEGTTVLVDTEVLNKTSKKSKVTLISSVIDANGKIIATQKANLSVSKGGKKKASEQQKIVLKNPSLWSPESPYLYNLETKIVSGGIVLDKVLTRFGVRDVKWVPETGMWLNGVNTKLQGICNHQSAGALGAAVPDKILRFRIQQLKDMGVNAIRTAHNAQTPRFYEMCDEMGMMVMDEFFDGWHKKAEHDYGAHDFADWWERDLISLVKRDRNHPSVVIYSVGNESKGDYGKKLVATCHKYDNSRLVTSGHAGPDDMDVFGENGGSEKKGFFETLEKDRAFIGTENVHTWHTRSFYRTKMWYRDGVRGKNGKNELYLYPDLTKNEIFTYDWTNGTKRTNARQTLRSSYDNSIIGLTVRHNIQKLRDIPNFAGSFRWTGYDYLGEVKYHGGWPFKSFSGGAIDLANFEKDLFYLYQSQWTTKPMVHILPHWTHPTMKLGTEIPVWVYSNCDAVELFLDGTSLGKQKPKSNHEEMQCSWMVPWKPGELKAIGYKDGVELTQKIIRTANAPTKIRLSVDGKPLLNKKNDIVQVRVTATDTKDELYPYGENRTYFKVIGNGKIRALDNGSPLDKETYFEAKSRIGFFGLTRAYIEATKAEGSINLLAASILGEKKLITSNKVSIDVKWINLRGADLYNNTVSVFYTTDGTRPTNRSERYQKPFKIKKGTIVKALVLLNEEEAFVMEEKFADNEGFYWDTVVEPAEMGGDQAEETKYKIGVVSATGKNFNGNGFLEFGPDSNDTGFVEWYYENDRSDGEFTLKLKYSGSSKTTPFQKVYVSINDKIQEVDLKSSKKYRSEWKVFKTKINLNAGANYIKVIPKDVTGLCIDELVVE